MPSFKPKANKKIKYNKKSATTLDGKHREFVNEFMKDEYDKIPELKKERKILLNNLDVLNEQSNTEQNENEGYNEYIEEIMNIKDRINEINENIKQLKERKKDYYLDNSKFIFDYFENKKNISNEQYNNTNINNSKTKLVNSFFKINKEEDNVIKNMETKTNNIVQQYLANVDDTFLDVGNYVQQTDICRYCYKGEMIPMEDEGVLICNNCYRNIPYLIENDKPSYKEPPKEVCFYAYKRINHFKEIIAQFQGKETTQIPQEVIENIKQQIKKERITISQITNQKTKEILKKLGYNKYYEHIPFIKDKLGIKPPVMSPELEETLFNLFMELQGPYSKFCPDDRVNFLNYYYTAYKLCELLGEDQYLPHFPMLKDREKRIDQDNIWKKICEELDWEFIPTI